MSWLSRRGARASSGTETAPADVDEHTGAAQQRQEVAAAVPAALATAPPAWPAGLTDEALPVKLVVTGPFGAGKTTLVRGVSELVAVDTEMLVSDATAALKAFTTVSLDFGALDLPAVDGSGGVRVALFGTPGQDRYSFMWRVLAEGMRGFVVVCDASRDHSRDQAREILRAFRRMAPGVPFLVAANRLDSVTTSAELDRLMLSLGLAPTDVDCLVGADIREPAETRAVLAHLLARVRHEPDHLSQQLDAFAGSAAS